MDTWEHRDRKVSSRKQSRAMSKPFKRKQDTQTAHKKRMQIKIKQAQKAKTMYHDDGIEDTDNSENS